MAPPTRYKVGEVVSGWRLTQLLGSGGNGEVWRAERDSLAVVALKILRQTRAGSEPYKRFANEARVLQQLGRHPGILPLLDFHLPASASRNDPAWLSMPIAIPLRDALPAEAPLLTAVQAIHSISATLAELTATRGLNHRDIKPENLYQHDGGWCIGDFGLVEDPTGEPLTEIGQLLGAKHYLAPELHSATNTSWASADLYALAKTLWVLITGQKYPPPGHLVRDVDYFRLTAYVQANEALRHLERLIERSTDPQQQLRPSMADFSRELGIWLNPAEHTLPSSPSDAVKERIRSAVLNSQQIEQRRQRLREYLQHCLSRLRRQLTPLAALIEETTGLKPQWGSFADLQTSSQVTQLSHLSDTCDVGAMACQITAPRQQRSGPVNYTAGVVLAITTSSELRMLAVHLITTTPAVVIPVWIHNATAPMDSLVEQETIAELLTALQAKAPDAMTAFAHVVES